MLDSSGILWSWRMPSKKIDGTPRVQWIRLWQLVAPYSRQMLIVLVCVAMIALLGVVPGIIVAQIINHAIPSRGIYELCLDVACIVIVSSLSAVVTIVRSYFNTLVSASIVRDVRTKIVSHLYRVPLDFFSNTKAGDILNRVNNDVDNLDNVLTSTITTIVSNLFIMVSTLCVMFAWNWRLALISIMILPLMILPLSPSAKRMYEIRKETREKRDEIQSITQETLSIAGIILLKAFARETPEEERVHKTGSDLMRMEVRLAMVGRWFIASMTAMIIIGPALLWLGGGLLSIRNAVDIGTIVAFASFIQTRLYGPAAALAGMQVQLITAMAIFERIFEYLDMQPEQYSVTKRKLDSLKGNVSFENVTMAYGDDGPVTLNNVSFAIRSGQTAALVGPSGAGKSTIAYLLLHLYKPQRGRITLDGIDITSVNLQSLRENIGIVTQDTYLLHDTIAANLRYGDPSATDDELLQAARAANIHDAILRMPQGYNTVVGPRGYKLSGGERQRIAIARVLLKNPHLLILDESTSSLDSANESEVQRALAVAMKGRTCLVIAHRLSTIRAADVILFLDRGGITEQGTHDELMARNGAYAKMYRQQGGGEATGSGGPMSIGEESETLLA